VTLDKLFTLYVPSCDINKTGTILDLASLGFCEDLVNNVNKVLGVEPCIC
jgi:hypothetical protein